MANILIFCSSSDHVSPMFFSEIGALGRGMAERGHRLIYGGAQVGLMGYVANEILKAGGEVLGVIPEFLNKPDIVHRGLTQLQVVDSMLDRKRVMIEHSDLIVAFPGGMGTIDELSEAISLKQLGQLEKKIIVYNFLDFWKPLTDCFEELCQQKMISQKLDELYITVNGVDEFFTILEKLGN